MKKNPIPSSVERELLRLERAYESGSLPEKDYELRKKNILARASGIPQGSNNSKSIKPKKIKPIKQKTVKSPNDHSLIKKAFPIILIGLLLIGLSFKLVPELGEKGSVIITTIEKSVPKEIVPSQPEEKYEPPTPTVPQIVVPPPSPTSSTITTPVETNLTPIESIIDKYLSLDSSTHTFSTEEASSITYGLQSQLSINVPRVMNFGTPSLYGGEGIINTSVVKGGYYLFSTKPPKDNNILLTIFVLEPGGEETFFRELSNYMGKFDAIYNINSKYYEKVSGPEMTATPFIQYQYDFYPNGDASFKSNVRLLAIKRSNLIIYAYYLDNTGTFTLQNDKEKKVIDYLKSFN